MTFSVHQAKTQFSKLLDMVENGEDVIVIRHGKPVAQLVPPRLRAKPVLGSMKDEIHWTEGWDRPMTDEEADAFLEGRE